MFGRSVFFALALAAILIVSVESFAQDAGVSGIPRGPGNAGGLNNSVNDPSGIGNATRIPPPPQPNIAVPVVPSVSPTVSTRVSPVGTRTRINRDSANLSGSEVRGSSASSSARTRSKPVDNRFNICKGC